MKELLFLAPLALIACNKETQFGATVESTPTLTHEAVDVTVSYAIPKKTYNVSAGTYFGEDPNPDGTDLVYSLNLLTPEDNEVTFSFNDLYANQQYHVRGWIETEDGNINLSDDYTINTQPLPALPCSVSSGNVDVDGTSYPAVTMSGATVGDNYVLSSSTSLGNINLYFNKEPKSAIYRTMDSETFVSDFEIVFEAWMDWGGSNCYYKANDHQDVYIENNNGTITAAFCGITMTKSAFGTCTNTVSVDGKLSE